METGSTRSQTSYPKASASAGRLCHTINGNVNGPRLTCPGSFDFPPAVAFALIPVNPCKSVSNKP